MFRHIVLFRWSDDATQDRIDAAFAGLAELPDRIPEIKGYHFGLDAGLADGNFDAAVVGDFDDVDAYRAYATNSAHTDLIAERLRPITAERIAVQHEF